MNDDSFLDDETDAISAELEDLARRVDLKQQVEEVGEEAQKRDARDLAARRQLSAEQLYRWSLHILTGFLDRFEEPEFFRVVEASSIYPGVRPLFFQRRRPPGRGIEVQFDSSRGQITVWRRAIEQGTARPIDKYGLDPAAPDVRERLRQSFRWVIGG
jgi:hypothetical protein